MSDEYLEIRPEDYEAETVIPSEAVRDLLAIAQLDQDVVTGLARFLSSLNGLVSRDELAEQIRRNAPSVTDEVTESLVRALHFAPPQIDMALKSLNSWREILPDRKKTFADDVVARLERNLRTLITGQESLALMRKANRLLRAVGNEFDSMAFFCDMRPVFDKSRRKIEGFVCLANMRLHYTSQDGEQHVFEIALTEDELAVWTEAIQDAVNKLSVMKSLNSVQRTKNTHG